MYLTVVQDNRCSRIPHLTISNEVKHESQPFADDGGSATVMSCFSAGTHLC